MSAEELARRLATAPVRDVTELAERAHPELWDSDEEYESPWTTRTPPAVPGCREPRRLPRPRVNSGLGAGNAWCEAVTWEVLPLLDSNQQPAG